MAYRTYGALVASVSVAVLMLAANQTFARSAAAPAAAPRGGFTSKHLIYRPSAALRHNRGNYLGTFWPTEDGYGPNGEPAPGGTQPASGDIHYTYTNDVPWDWAHRYPPNVAPSERPYVPGCYAEGVTVPARGGREQTVNVTRCY
jgi:hypothetical protein